MHEQAHTLACPHAHTLACTHAHICHEITWTFLYVFYTVIYVSFKKYLYAFQATNPKTGLDVYEPNIYSIFGKSDDGFFMETKRVTYPASIKIGRRQKNRQKQNIRFHDENSSTGDWC